jgi:ATP-dependent helicase/nuclease subunit A
MQASRPADHAEREKAIRERKRNVIVDAGAGTGKTTLLVARILHLIAPDDDGSAYPLDTIAAITFTRKAAGELKLRLREKLLSEAGRHDLNSVRRQRLASALEVLDNAAISTVHSFADRLLRLRPVDAKLSPAYEIAEDSSALIAETFAALLADAAQGAAIGGSGSSGVPATAEAYAFETIRLFQAAGLLVRTEQTEWADKLGLDAFVRDVVETRDRSVNVPERAELKLELVRRHVDELSRELKKLELTSPGGKRLAALHKQAVRLSRAEDAMEALRRAVLWWKDFRKTAKHLKKNEHFADEPAGWEAWKWICEGARGSGKRKEERPGGPLADAIVEPLFGYMATRLVRLRPVILERYENVKKTHGLVDQIDLLIQLRNLLQRDHEARAFYQSKFDHLLVDEFQDTDPLQAEIVMYLCESRAQAKTPDEIRLHPGKLTIVGDPKQSIYRFRRADIAMYAKVCDQLRASGACEAQLTVNFRSAATILDWLNEGFDAILGRASDGPLFDAEKGTVRNVRLLPAGESHSDAAVHVLPFGNDELNAEESRDVEGEALAHYIRFLVEDSAMRIRDPRTGQLQRPRYGDIAIMMIATQTVHHLTSELDRVGVPHVVRGGTLFMQDPLHQQFILGLRALSDRGDGVARAALMRPPFFAVTLEDLVRARALDTKSEALDAAEQLITKLRAERHRVTPGEFARRVLETTGFGRYVAAGVNGGQRLARLYELCLVLDEVARTSCAGFDGVTAIAREWLDAPPRIEAPLPVDADAVQVITAHQAKGLEWPIVALWDGRAGWRAFLPQSAFTLDPMSGEWAITLEGLVHDPSDKALHKREMSLRAAERKRVAYVAATRARDLLIMPEAGEPSDKTIAGMLLLKGAEKPHHRVAPYKGDDRGGKAWWHAQTPVSMRPLAPIKEGLAAAWNEAAQRGLAEYLCPVGITTIAHAVREDVRDADEGVVRPAYGQSGRFGPAFGLTVHRALQLVLKKQMNPDVATRQAARENGVELHVDAAIADVERACAALRAAGLLGPHELRVEYPVAGSLEERALVSGYVDLLVAMPDGLCVIDFKTDAPPLGDVAVQYPGYVEQVRAYARVLEGSGVSEMRVVRQGLLFTADGGLRWV